MRVLGFEIRFDLTWLIVVALIVWSLSAGLFPAAYENLPTSTYVWMGVLGAIGLFASIVLHELAHSVVGRRLGMHIRGITLFAFGGASELSEEPATARTEFLMAIAGPAMALGSIGIEEAKRVPPERRAFRPVRDHLTPLGADSTIAPDAGARQALEQMQRTGQSRLFVTEGDRLIGVLTLRDLLQYLSVKTELNAAGEGRPPPPRSLRHAAE